MAHNQYNTKMKFQVYGKTIIAKKVKGLKQSGTTASYKGGVIEYDADLKGDSLTHALMHELFHAFCDRLGLENLQISNDLEELLADNITNMFLENFDIKCKTKKVR